MASSHLANHSAVFGTAKQTIIPIGNQRRYNGPAAAKYPKPPNEMPKPATSAGAIVASGSAADGSVIPLYPPIAESIAKAVVKFGARKNTQATSTAVIVIAQDRYIAPNPNRCARRGQFR